MSSGVHFDTSDFIRHLENLSSSMKKETLRDMGRAGGDMLVAAQKAKLLEYPAYLTGATHDSVDNHDDELTDTRYVNEVGPETVYAPNIEWGRRDMPNYPVRPYVRSTASTEEGRVLAAITTKFRQKIEDAWHG